MSLDKKINNLMDAISAEFISAYGERYTHTENMRIVEKAVEKLRCTHVFKSGKREGKVCNEVLCDRHSSITSSITSKQNTSEGKPKILLDGIRKAKCNDCDLFATHKLADGGFGCDRHFFTCGKCHEELMLVNEDTKGCGTCYGCEHPIENGLFYLMQ